MFVPSEPASIGTLFKLGKRTLDILRNLIACWTGHPTGGRCQRLTADAGLDVWQGVYTARRNALQ
jgi:hypothetical protein